MNKAIADKNNYWTIRGISNEVKDEITLKARQQNITIGRYINTVIYPTYKNADSALKMDDSYDNYLESITNKMTLVSDMISKIYNNDMIELLDNATKKLESAANHANIANTTSNDNETTKTLLRALEKIISS